MSFSDWINFAALANIIAFLWVFRASLAREDRVTAVRDALRLKTGNLPFKAWWIAFLLSVSYRLGATASATPEAVAYGLFPTLLLALLLIDLAEAKVAAYDAKLKSDYRRAKRRTARAREEAQTDAE